MPDPQVWDDNPGDPAGMTPFGYYDTDSSFLADAPRVARFCATRLGYPILDVEMIDRSFYACFEEAITEYAAQVNQFNIRENMLLEIGLDANSNLTQTPFFGTPLPQIITIAKQYGAEVGSGGNIDWQRSKITTRVGQQTYDLQALFDAASGSGNRIEIKKVWHDNSPAIARYYDPYAGAGIGLQNLMTEFGFDGYSPAVNFVMMPAYEDLLRIQAIEFNDMIRKSAFTFSIINNKLKIFPIPTSVFNIYFDYITEAERWSSSLDTGSAGQVADYSNAPYKNITYSKINAPGKMWIFKYTLALSKELLGEIRSKYSTIPIPNAEVSLDGPTLRSEATAEKEQLVTQLRENLNEAGKKAQMQKQLDNMKNMQEMLSIVPNFIYIG